MRLLDPERFEILFEPLSGQRVGFAALDGNVGDAMSHGATAELFDHFGISWRPLSLTRKEVQSAIGDLDQIVVSGGGNMGRTGYPIPWKQRQLVLALGLPVTVFPQSFITDDEDTVPYARVYVREIESQRLDSRFQLAPDMALGLTLPLLEDEPRAEMGVFLRKDCERALPDHNLSLGDPADMCASVEEYIGLAARFEKIVTDRLHFAIAGLLLRRDVTLLPNSYFKNRAMYETWLYGLGCHWRHDTRGIVYDKDAAEHLLAPCLESATGDALPWSAQPIREKGYALERLSDKLVLRHADGMHIAECDETTFIVWQLCDGSHSINDIVQLLGDAYPETRPRIAVDTQTILQTLRANGAIDLIDSASHSGPRPSVRVATENARDGKAPQRREHSAATAATRLDVFPPIVRDGRIRLSARLCTPGAAERILWYEGDARLSSTLTRRADPFVLTSLMYSMQEGRPLEVRGAPVSGGLLRNLEEFQRAWASWRTRLSEIPIFAEEEDDELNGHDRAAVVGFSGGVDSCYTVYRHLVSPDGRYDRKLQAALMIHGFDISLDDAAQFEAARRRSQRILDGLGIDLLAIRTNIKSLSEQSLDWLDSHGLVLGSALTLLSGRFGAGIIAGTMPYVMLLPLGSSPVTDWLMGSRRFEIVHHGAQASRLDKVRTIARWPAAIENLRVCWAGKQLDRNCGVCLKCVLTQLQFWAVGANVSCFDNPLSEKVVRHALDIPSFSRLDWVDLHAVLREAQERKLSAPWLAFLEKKLRMSG